MAKSKATPKQKVRWARDARIRAAARRGDRPERIAEVEHVSLRTVRRVVAEDPERATLPTVADVPVGALWEVDPLGEVARAVRVHREAIVGLRAVAARSRNEAVTVGALKAAASASSALVGLLTTVGLTPPNAARWRDEVAWAALWTGLGTALSEIGVEDTGDLLDRVARHAGMVGGARLVLEGLGPRVEVPT